MIRLTAILKRFGRDERGSVPVEYGMIAVLISIVCVALWQGIGSQTNVNFSGITAGLK